MKSHASKTNLPQEDCYTSDNALNGGHRERRRIELKRRVMALQSRRVNLERELERVKSCLLTLDKQINNNVNFERNQNRVIEKY